ncbi:MAG: prepilin-type N-terminal cleavage/methylation domain-containing protein [Deltaproteobacteria bacterium]|nr:prepilin-type N-terminal cleavage/methylation domain-containing protein [Deltaproteobacteria bacterium]
MNPRQDGFTLLEVIAALSIIAIALTTLLVSQSQSLSLAGEAKFSTTATLLAQHKMAELETKTAEDLISDSGDFGEDFPNYFWEVQVNPVSFPGVEQNADDLKQIDLNVFFGEDKQFQCHVRLYRFAPP